MEFVQIIEKLEPGDAVQLTGDLGSMQVKRLETGFSLTGDPIHFQDFESAWQQFVHCLFYNSVVGPHLRLVVLPGEAIPRPQIIVPGIQQFGQAGESLRTFATELTLPEAEDDEDPQIDASLPQGPAFSQRITPLLETSEPLARRIVPALSPPGVLLDFEDWLVHLFPGSREADIDILIAVSAIDDADADGLYLRAALELNNADVVGAAATLEMDEDLDVLFLSCSYSWQNFETDPQSAILASLGVAIEIGRRIEGDSIEDFSAPVNPDVDDLAFFYMNRV